MNLSKNTVNSENNATAEEKGRAIFKQKKLNEHSYNNAITRTTPGHLQCEVKEFLQKYSILKVWNMLTAASLL